MKQHAGSLLKLTKNTLDNIMDELSCLLIVFLEVISVLIIVYFSINVVFSAEDKEWGDRQHQEITPAEVTNGALLFKTDVVGRYIPASTVSTDVDINVNGMIARATVRQTFVNESSQWLQGIYVFPLPEDAAVDHLKMIIGNRIIIGEIQTRKKAKQIYNKAKQAGRKASLIEQHRPNIFRNSVANIGPNETVVIEIQYQQTVSYQLVKENDNIYSSGNGNQANPYNGKFSLRFPMAITPRYIPGVHPARQRAGKVINEQISANSVSGWAINTDQVPDASEITPPIELTPRIKHNKITLRVELNAGFDIESLTSKYHKISKVHHGKGVYTVSILPDETEQSVNHMDRDFSLSWQTAIGKHPKAAVFSEKINQHFYHLLMIMPPTEFDNAIKPLSREVVFIIDTSGSMGGASIRQARKALSLAIDKLKPRETFNIIEFNSTAHKLYPRPVQASLYNKKHAIDFVNNLQANGGTEMASALHLALDNQQLNKEQYPVNKKIRQVIFLTDGSVGNETYLFSLIKNKLANSRLFTVGIGSAPNSHFMKKAASFGRGTFTYIGKVSEVNEKMTALFNKLESPVLKNINLQFNAGNNTKNLNVDSLPKQQPDLYLGEPLLIVSRSAEKLIDLFVMADRQVNRWKMDFKIEQAKKSSGIGVLWARSKIAQLSDKMLDVKSDSTQSEQLKSKITRVALQHHLVSRYTSLVAVDKTPSRPLSELLKSQQYKNNLPKGMDKNKVFKQLPQTATSAQLDFIKGSLLLILAFAMLWQQRNKNQQQANKKDVQQ